MLTFIYKLTLKTAAASAVFLIASAYAAYPQDKTSKADSLKHYLSPTITVTSNRAIERLSPVPFSEIDQSEIDKSYANTDIAEYLTRLPSIISYSQSGNAIGYSNLTMRGFDQRRISVMINGIPQNDPEDHNVYWIDFPDLMESLESIQVQRGAGLTQYGAAAIGGSINLTTSGFLDRRMIRFYSGIGFQQFGSDDNMPQTMGKFLFEASSGIVGNYAFYFRLSRINSDGYRDRSWAYLNSYFMSAVRFDENMTTQINIFGGPFSDGLVYNGLPKSYIGDLSLRRSNLSFWTYDQTGSTLDTNSITARRKQEIEEFSQPHYEILNDWTISPGLSLKTSLFYYTGEGFYDYDGSWADTTMLRLTAANGLHLAENPRNTLIRAWVSNRQGGLIPRLVWKHDSRGTATIGAEIRIHNSQHWGNIRYAENLPVGFDPDYQFYYNEGSRQAFSIFAREQYSLTDNLLINAELQVVRQNYSIGNEKAGNTPTQYFRSDGSQTEPGGKIFDIGYTFVNPRLGANYNFDKNTSFYGLVAYTSREPRMRNLYAAEDAYSGALPLFEGIKKSADTTFYDFSKPLAKPESMIDIELGCIWRTDKYFFNANFYLMDYSDELVKSGRLDIFGNPIDGNAPRTSHAGIELQGSAVLLDGSSGRLMLKGNATVSINKINEYNFITNLGDTVSLADNEIAGFPGFLANIGLSYEIANFYFGLSCKHVGSYRTDNFGDKIKSNAKIVDHLKADWLGYYADNTLDDYTVFNADISYTFKNVLSLESLRLQAQVNNIFNLLYAAGAEGREFFPAAERSFFIAIDLGL